MLLAAALLLGTRGARAYGPFPATPATPATYASPSGRFRLEVNPTLQSGDGSARYRLTKGGREVWAGERPFTFRDAAVAEDGTAAGFGYSSSGQLWGSFNVGILSPTGRVRLAEEHPRTTPPHFHASPNPLGTGVFIDPAHHRVVIRVFDEEWRGLEWWWPYDLSTGRALPRFQPSRRMPPGDPAQFVLEAKNVPGTPLTLLHWWRAMEDHDHGSTYTLVDAEASPVWRLDLPQDGVPALIFGRIPLEIEPQTRVEVSKSGHFTVRSRQEKQAIDFAVSGRARKWTIRELRRKPLPPAPAGPSASDECGSRAP